MYWTFNVTAEDVPEPEPEPENEWVCEPPPPSPFVLAAGIPPAPSPAPTVPPAVPGAWRFIPWAWDGICPVESVVAPVVPLMLVLIVVDTV